MHSDFTVDESLEASVSFFFFLALHPWILEFPPWILEFPPNCKGPNPPHYKNNLYYFYLKRKINANLSPSNVVRLSK